jgi:hypothetical protein
MKTRRRLPEPDLRDQLLSKDPEAVIRAQAAMIGLKPCTDCIHNPCISCSNRRFGRAARDPDDMLYCAAYRSIPLAERRKWCRSFKLDPDADIRNCAHICHEWIGCYSS